jgi:DNA-binding transcriptional ArsR family regulator
MDVTKDTDDSASRIASAIGEPARARMLFCLLDHRARTSTELAVIADVSPSTASAHLNRLKSQRLIKVHVHGKFRYFSLAGPQVARVLEALNVLASGSRDKFAPKTPDHLHLARTCYDHVAGKLGVLLHDRLLTLQWLAVSRKSNDNSYDVTTKGIKALEPLGIEIENLRTLRRKFAFACLDWSEHRPHLGGALAAALLKLALKKRWVTQDLDSRALSLTPFGRRQILNQFGVTI